MEIIFRSCEKLKRILIVFTGGTISMKKDKELDAAVPIMTGEEILKLTPGLTDIADVDFYNFSMIPGPHMTPEKMFELAIAVENKCNDYDGVVITHGTDSLEETAFLLDLVVQSHKPIIFTGAMKNSSELGWDGPSNLYSAIKVAVDDHSNNKGVLVVMNNEIHSASQVIKTDASKLDTFKSCDLGPLGYIDNDKVFYYQLYLKHQSFATRIIDSKVDLIKCACGMNSKLINWLIDTGTHGIVIEGMGRGNIPPEMIEGVQKAIHNNIPIILVSRCQTGKALDSYGYAGAGKDLTNRGVILGDNLSGQKARIKLMVALGITKDIRQIKAIFENSYY